MAYPFGCIQRLALIVLLCVVSVLTSEAQEQAPSLSLEDVEEARRLILSDQVDLKSRVDLAKRLSILFEQIGRPETARKLTLDFIASANDQFRSTSTPPSGAGDWGQIAETIHAGKYNTAAKAIAARLEKSSSTSSNPTAIVLALKSDDMLTAYQLFYEELATGVRSAYSDYFLSILAAREKRVSEAAQLMKQAEGRLSPERLNQWVAMDRAKLATVMKDYEVAETLLKALLKEAPDDPHIMYLYLLFDFARGQKDQAGRRLLQLVPKLKPDPYLLAQAATLAVRLNELDTAAAILETHEPNIESNRDFYEAFALVKKAQGKPSEADDYVKKANQMKETRVAVEARGEQERLLSQALASARKSSGPSTAEMDGVTPVSKAYLYLLENKPKMAEAALLQRIQSGDAEPTEYSILQTIQRRSNKLGGAITTLQQLKKAHPTFQPYVVLSLLADYCVRANDPKQAQTYYQELVKMFPESNQAKAAKQWLDNNQLAPSVTMPIKPSTILTRYPNYGAPFALSEIINYWDESTTFSKVSTALGVSADRSIQFHQLVPIILNGSSLEIHPVAPTFEALSAILNAGVPVILCYSDLFGSQLIESVLLLVGFDSSQRVVYAEGVRGDDPHVLTEAELASGIGLALHPGTVNMPDNETAQTALALGADQVRLNLDAIMLEREEIESSDSFTNKMKSVAKESGVEHVPLQIAYARWLVRRGQPQETIEYLDAIKANCNSIGEYHFLRTHYYYSQKDYANAHINIQSALDLQPQHPRWSLALARVLYTQDKIDNAIETCEEICRQHPEDLTAAVYLLSLYEKTGNTEKLQQETQRVKEALSIDDLPLGGPAEPKPE